MVVFDGVVEEFVNGLGNVGGFFDVRVDDGRDTSGDFADDGYGFRRRDGLYGRNGRDGLYGLIAFAGYEPV